MNYFNYMPDSNKHMGKVWNLFESMTTEEIERGSYEYSLDIVKAALNGRITLEGEEGENFPLREYTAGCKRNTRLTNRANTKKELFIVDSFTEDENEKIGFGDVSERVLKDIDTLFDTLVDDQTFEQCLVNLMGIRNEYIVKQGIDPVEIIRGSIKQMASSMKILSSLVKEDNRVSQIVDGLLGTGHGDEVLSRLAAMGV